MLYINQIDRSIPSWVAVAVFLCFSSSIAVASDYTCPLSIEAEKKVKTLYDGWSVKIKAEKHLLHHVEFFDGPVEEMSSQIPDVDGERYAIWKFPSYSRGIWLGCFYDGSIVMLSRRLPDALSECRVTYGSKFIDKGARHILGIECN
jgi:hypothetical protein